jgi:hypothetical protein
VESPTWENPLLVIVLDILDIGRVLLRNNQDTCRVGQAINRGLSIDAT